MRRRLKGLSPKSPKVSYIVGMFSITDKSCNIFSEYRHMKATLFLFSFPEVETFYGGNHHSSKFFFGHFLYGLFVTDFVRKSDIYLVIFSVTTIPVLRYNRCVAHVERIIGTCWGDRSRPMMTSSKKTFSALLVICAGNSPVPGEFPAQRPVTWSFYVSLICVWINGLVNNREAGDLRRYRDNYDVDVMQHMRSTSKPPPHMKHTKAFS